MFEKAARLKLRFNTSAGPLSAEDLWDLPLTSVRSPSLDDIGMGLMDKLQKTSKSLVNPNKGASEIDQLRFDIVKHIIDVRLKEKEEADQLKAKADQKQKILALIAQKEDSALAEKSIEELRQLVEAL